MRAVDRFVDSLRAAIEHALPWYDPAAASGRSRDTERIRRRSIKARLDAEAVIRARYTDGERALR